MFNEKDREYSAKQGKEIPVWKSPKYEQSKEKALEIIKKYDNIGEGDFWILMNESKSGKMIYTGLIISHNACLKLNDHMTNNNKFMPECVEIDKEGFGNSLVFTYINPAQGIYEVGEVSKDNCKNAYPYAMAFKRCFDRVVLKLTKLAYDGVYSDSEADEFQKQQDVVNVKDKLLEREEWKSKVLEVARSKGISPKELAGDYKISKDTDTERLKEIYNDLVGSEI